MLALALAIAVAAVALVVRWDHITSLPLDFHPDRQYHSFYIAREYYIRNFDAVPDWKRDVARVNYEVEPPIELPILEVVAATAYRLSGGEHLWIPRVLSSLFWITGGLLLYLIATTLAPWWAASLAVAIYLFSPFPLVASTSFQPDPFMIMLLLAAVLATIRYHGRLTRQRFVAALVLTGIAVLAKPGIAAFFLFPLFAALAIARDGARRAFAKPTFYAFPAVSFVPTAVLYVYSVIADKFLTNRVEIAINPRLLGESFYWRGWLHNVVAVLRPPLSSERLTLVLLGVAISVLLLARTRTHRAILLSLWGGYAAFGLVLSNQVSTHDYYSLPLVPIAGLSIAGVVGVCVDYMRGPLRRRSVQAGAVAVLAVIAAFGVSAKAGNVRLPQADSRFERPIEEYERIGELVNHTTHALVLEPGGLWFHGWVAGRYWPNEGDLLWERRNDRLRPMSADERFVTTDESYWPAVGTMRPRPSAFVVLEPIELIWQPDLAVLLSDFRMREATPDYVIFDLTRAARSTDRGRRDSTRIEATRTASMTRYFYRFPPIWRNIERGMTRGDVLRVLGKPARSEVRRDLRKPFEAWFYGPKHKYAIGFVERAVFVKAVSFK